MANISLCSIPDCGKPSIAKGFCQKHYCRWKRHGDPNFRYRKANGELLEFIENVVIPYKGQACLIWPFYRDKNGYARAGNGIIVSTMACERVNGPKPNPSDVAAHSCQNGHLGCVSPGHVRWISQKENIEEAVKGDRFAKGESHVFCKLTEDDVRNIRNYLPDVSHNHIARQFNVSPALIRNIRKRLQWKWLT